MKVFGRHNVFASQTNSLWYKRAVCVSIVGWVERNQENHEAEPRTFRHLNRAYQSRRQRNPTENYQHVYITSAAENVGFHYVPVWIYSYVSVDVLSGTYF